MTEEIDQSENPAPESPGAMLFRLRAASDLSLAEVAQRLKYRQRQIEALEHDDFSKLPGMTFVRGMIRGYARLLKADPEVILSALDRRNFPNPAAVDLRVSEIPFPDGKKRTTLIYGAVSATLIALAVLIGYEVSPWSFESGIQVQSSKTVPASSIEPVVGMQVTPSAPEMPNVLDSTPSGDASIPLPQATSAETVKVATSLAAGGALTEMRGGASSNKRIALQFDRDSWVEIRQANGKTLLSQLNPGGSRQVVEGVPPFVLIIGNAPNVHLSYNDQPVDLRPHFKVDVARLTLE